MRYVPFAILVVCFIISKKPLTGEGSFSGIAFCSSTDSQTGTVPFRCRDRQLLNKGIIFALMQCNCPSQIILPFCMNYSLLLLPLQLAQESRLVVAITKFGDIEEV